MSEVLLHNPHGQSVSADARRNHSQLTAASRRQASAYAAVSQQNKLAAIDHSELSSATQMQGRFSFDFAGNSSSSSTKISWQGSFSSEMSQGSFQTNFSFGFSMSHSMQVQLNEGIVADEQGVRGDDFEFDREGILRLLDKLAEKLGLGEDEREHDLGGEISRKLQDILDKLGLLDEQGKATPPLQMLSDYAGQGRFKAGQQVRTNVGLEYSAQLNTRMLSWQGWQQSSGTVDRPSSGGEAPDAGNAASGNVANAATNTSSGIGGANSVSGNNIGGDVYIDDRDVINITVEDKSHDKITITDKSQEKSNANGNGNGNGNGDDQVTNN